MAMAAAAVSPFWGDLADALLDVARASNKLVLGVDNELRLGMTAKKKQSACYTFISHTNRGLRMALAPLSDRLDEYDAKVRDRAHEPGRGHGAEFHLSIGETDLRVLDGLYAIQTIFASASLHGHVQNGVGSALFRFGDKKVSGAAGKLVLKKVPTVATLKGIDLTLKRLRGPEKDKLRVEGVSFKLHLAEVRARHVQPVTADEPAAFLAGAPAAPAGAVRAVAPSVVTEEDAEAAVYNEISAISKQLDALANGAHSNLKRAAVVEAQRDLFRRLKLDCKNVPLDRLHLFDLGLCKYFLTFFTARFKDNTQAAKLFVALWDDLDQRCMHRTPVRSASVLRHVGSFRGYEHRQVMQFLPCVLLQLGSHTEDPVLFRAVTQLACVAKLVCLHARERHVSPEQHVRDVDASCQDLISACVALFPEWAATAKLHQVAHIAENIQQFGPLNGFEASPFESQHKISRHMAEATNRRQTAKDIARQAARVARMRALVRGGRNMGDDLVDHRWSAEELALVTGHSAFADVQDVVGQAHVSGLSGRFERRPALTAAVIHALADANLRADDLHFYATMRLNRKCTVRVGAWVDFKGPDRALAGRVRALAAGRGRTVVVLSAARTVASCALLHGADELHYEEDELVQIVAHEDLLGTASVIHHCSHSNLCVVDGSVVVHRGPSFIVNPYTM